MNKLNRTLNIFKGLVTLAIGLVILLVDTSLGYVVACLIIGIFITCKGIGKLIYFFSSARHMVGGRIIFINSVVYIDLGLVSIFVLLETPALAMAYLVCVFMLDGVIDITRCVELKKNDSKKWILKLIKGLITILIGIVCIVSSQSIDVALLIFGIGWIVLAVEDFIAAFSKSAIQYIPEV